MEGERRYRWERRRKRLAGVKRARTFQSFWIFEMILLILIFAVWLIGARFVQIYAVLTTRCAEDLAAFGSGTTIPSAFVLLFWTSVLIAVFWLIISLAHWSILRRSKTVLFHLSLLLSVLLLAANFRAMHISDNQPADGTLVTGVMIIDKSLEEDQYFEFPLYDEEYTVWNMGRPSSGTMTYNIYEGHCVWLDRNLILVRDSVQIDGYGAATKEQRREMLFEQQYRELDIWKPTSFLLDVSLSLGQLFSSQTLLENLRDAQTYRPLNPDERQRFVQKQACLENLKITVDRDYRCKWYYGFDLEKERYDAVKAFKFPVVHKE